MHFIDKKDFYIEEDTVLSLGKFDGEHKGHRKIFNKLLEVVELKGLKGAILTFDVSPSKLTNTDKEVYNISTSDEKRQYFENLGVDYLVEYPFDRAILTMPARDFVIDILINRMKMKAIVAGTDCSFGYKKSGNIELLREMSAEYNFEVYEIEKETDSEDREISSSLIKELIVSGYVFKANELLEDIYTLRSTVVEGNKIGKIKLGFPTANIYPPKDKLIPKLGVYATFIKLLEDGRVFLGLSNIGTNPSIKDDKDIHRLRIETHIYDFDEDIYNKEIELGFVEFIREQKKFNSLEELKAQIAKDKEEVYRRYLRGRYNFKHNSRFTMI